ncbi:MAG: hypothetical protein J6T10_13725 [Methanobrevibacter sp.]|nr:hypothetical protein [Methanobrevibacter sp.]
MTLKEIEKRENKPLFKIFLRRIGFKNFDEYFDFFGNDIDKRSEAVRRFLKTYPNLSK